MKHEHGYSADSDPPPDARPSLVSGVLPKSESGFPEVINKFRLDEVYVDGTPDGNYAVRILEAYRRRCDCIWKVEGLDEGRTALYDSMNEHQKQRAYELDAAIRWLKARI